jgi:membrane-associated phospholipid phosphatase
VSNTGKEENPAAFRNDTNSLNNALLNPTDKVVIAYLAIIAALILIFSFRIPLWPQLIAAHAAAIAVVTLIAKWSPSLPRRVAYKFQIGYFVRSWYAVVLIPITYKELSYLIPLIHPRDFDTELAMIDYRIFGVHPTLWIERLTWPALTEFLQLSYATYYFWPIALGALLWRKRWFDKYHFWVFIVAIGFYLSYLGYLLVPATGPRFLPMIKDAQSMPLTGIWFYQTIRETLDKAEGITRDCFPSGHTELTLLTLYYAHKFHRRLFWLMFVPASALIISTVYLRYHYVIDVFAGALLALAVIVVSKPLYRALGGHA